MPSLYLNVVGGLASGRSSVNVISSPRLRKAITCRRSTTVCARNSVSSKIAASGQNVTVVPVRPRGALPVTSSFPLGFPPSPNSNTWWSPSRSISSRSRVERALTTETPTPWSPPETLYPPPSPNLPPACSVVRTTSAADFPLYLGIGPMGMPRPSSATRIPPSARTVTSIWVQKPAIASSTALSTTSQTRWWRPVGPVEPMYIPGRFRTGSRPSRTVMFSAVYRSVFSATGAPFHRRRSDRESAHPIAQGRVERTHERVAIHQFQYPIVASRCLGPGPPRRPNRALSGGRGPPVGPVSGRPRARPRGPTDHRRGAGPAWPTQDGRPRRRARHPRA